MKSKFRLTTHTILRFTRRLRLSNIHDIHQPIMDSMLQHHQTKDPWDDSTENKMPPLKKAVKIEAAVVVMRMGGSKSAFIRVPNPSSCSRKRKRENSPITHEQTAKSVEEQLICWKELHHFQSCIKRGCARCDKTWELLRQHSRQCRCVACSVPCCMQLRR